MLRCTWLLILLTSAPAAAKPLEVLLISGSLEYKSDECLTELQKYLEANYNIKCFRAFRKTDTDIPGLEKLADCDVAVFYTRRLSPPKEQLDRIKQYLDAGKPVVGLRTASHGFQNYLAFDKDILGGSYTSHFGVGPKCAVTLDDKAKDHPLLAGVQPFTSPGSLYKNQANAADTTRLLLGTIPNHSEPVAWFRTHKQGRVFYTSLGHPDDFTDPNFRKLVVNALFWTTNRDVPAK
jgi:type 1 glutamine amidotransferase